MLLELTILVKVICEDWVHKYLILWKNFETDISAWNMDGSILDQFRTTNFGFSSFIFQKSVWPFFGRLIFHTKTSFCFMSLTTQIQAISYNDNPVSLKFIKQWP